jgi:hypothetical protein
MIKDGNTRSALLELIRKKNQEQSRPLATRTNMRMNLGPHGEAFSHEQNGRLHSPPDTVGA